MLLTRCTILPRILLQALLLLGIQQGTSAQSVTDQQSYDAWKAALVPAQATTVGTFGPGDPPAKHGEHTGELRGGGGTCECWHEPDAGYTLINNNAQWDACGFQNADDGSYGPINLPFSYYLYGQYYNTIYINTNGNITMQNCMTGFTATGFPDPQYVIVGAFWADVDLRPTGANINKVQYKVTPTAFYVNWTNVGYYSMMTDKLNTFQIIITDGTDPVIPGGANTSFCYKDMQWTTGAANSGVGGFGGNPANVGANKGDGINYLQFGRFDHAGNDYDGPYGASDGISFLDEQHFPFSTDITTGNVPPIVSGQSVCDSLVLCVGDPGTLDFIFLSPEPGQITTPTASSSTLGGFTILSSNPGQTADISILVTPALSDTGYHYITVEGTDDGVPSLTTTVNIVVHVLPSPVQPPASLDVCGNGSSVALFGYLNGSPPAGGDWTDPLGDAHNGTFVPSANEPGVYTYAVDTTGGCPMIATVDVTLYTMQNDSVLTDALCFGDGTGSIEVISSGNGGPWNYEWTDANGNVVQTTTNATGDTFNGSGGPYTVIITEGPNGNGCVDSLQAFLYEPTAVEMLSLSDDTTICRTGTATLIAEAQGGTGGLVAHWNDGITGWARSVTLTATTDYSVWATDANGCYSDTLTVEVNVLAPITFTLPDTVITCPEVDVHLQPDPVLGGDLVFEYGWTGQGISTSPDLTMNTTWSQQVCLTVNDGCETPPLTQCLWLDVLPIPEIIFAVDSTLGCDPFFVHFGVLDTTGGATVDWDFGDDILIPGPPANVGHTFTDPGIYDISVVVHWPNGCDDDSTFTDLITVAAVPDAQFTWTPDPASTLDPMVTFTDQSGPYAESWIWDFAGMDTAHGPEAGFLFPGEVGGTYPVQLVVANYLGCADTVVRNIDVVDEFLLFVPTAFSPDGDGLNEALFVLGDDIATKDFTFMIFDRWGEKIHESTDRSEGWDGRYKGAAVQNGVYSWLVKARSVQTGRGYEFLGHVMVVR